MNRPIVTGGSAFRDYSWPDLRVRVHAERYDADGSAELGFYQNNGTGEVLLHRTRANLLSTPTMNSLANRLEKNATGVCWPDVIAHVTEEILQVARQGEPPVPIGRRPGTMRIDYQLRPILEKGQPTTIYGPGGFAKSYLAGYFACLVQFGVSGAYDWQPQQGNVLYLDWESSPKDHERRAWAIKQGLDLDTEDTFLYRACAQPLVADIHSLQRMIEEHGIELLIVDSQMAAAGHGPDPSQVSSQYYNALRSLRCTTLTLDHVSKSEWGRLSEAESTGPYGSVVKFNRSRSQFEIRKSQEAGDEFLELALVHRKHNEGKLLRPFGIRIDFVNTSDGELEWVTFSACDVSDNPELSKVHTLKERLSAILGAGPRSVKELADELDKPEGTIRSTLNRHKGTFLNTGDEWELKAYEA